MIATITIHKSQGEARVRDKLGALVATQHAKFFAIIRGEDGHPIFTTQRTNSAAEVKRRLDALFGALPWRGTPDREVAYGECVVDLQIKGRDKC